MPIAELFLSSVVQTLLSELNSRVLSDDAHINGISEKLNNWKLKLQTIQTFVDSAEKKQKEGNSAFDLWLAYLKDVANDMEDLLAHLNVDLPDHLNVDLLDRPTLLKDHRMANEIEEVDRQLEEVLRLNEIIQFDENFRSSLPANVAGDTICDIIAKVDTRTITDWEKGQLLGRGSFGSVYEGIADGGFFFAIKEVSLHDQGAQESILQLEQEVALLSQFKHENIVRYYGTEKDELNLYIFLELVTKGSLLNLYHTYHLQDSQVSAYTRQILNGLKYLHDCNVVHRDIKCANILVDASGSVKLADFGLAKATRLNDVKSCKGTVFWMAPEVVRAKSNGYGLPADIWSLGCTVLEMLTRQLPYYPLEPAQAVFRIGKGERPPVPDTLSADATDFILRCIRVNPDDRPTAAQLLGHPFLKLPP